MDAMSTKLISFLWILCLLKGFASALESDLKPPHILEPDQPEIRYHTQNTNVTIRCHAEGEPKPSFKWRKNGTRIKVDDAAISTGIRYDATTGNLYIPHFTKQDEGIYMCEASTAFTNKLRGITTATTLSPPITLYQTRLSNINPPIITNNIAVPVHNYLKLHCDYEWDVVAANVVYSWYKDMSKMSMDNGRLFVDQAGNLHFSYVLQTDSTQQKSALACGIYIPEEKSVLIGHSNYVTVKSVAEPEPLPPVLQYSNSNFKVLRFGQAKLECMFSGHDPQPPHYPTTRWYDDSGREITSTGDKYSLSDDNRTLTINSVEEEDEKNYYCQAKSYTAESKKEPVFLDVTSAPIFENSEDAPKDQTVPENQDAIFHCNARSAVGEKEPNSPQWYINGVKTGVHTERNKYVLSEDMKTLTIRDVRMETDFLCVQCEVTNHVGTTWANACLQVVKTMKDYTSPVQNTSAVYVVLDSGNDDSNTVMIVLIIVAVAISATIVNVIIIMINRQRKKRRYENITRNNLHDLTASNTDADEGRPTSGCFPGAEENDERITEYEEDSVSEYKYEEPINKQEKPKGTIIYEAANGHIYQCILEKDQENEIVDTLFEGRRNSFERRSNDYEAASGHIYQTIIEEDQENDTIDTLYERRRNSYERTTCPWTNTSLTNAAGLRRTSMYSSSTVYVTRSL